MYSHLMYTFFVFTGIQKHALGGVTGWLFGAYADNYRNQYLAERDAVLRHYVELHPEDFPVPGKYNLSMCGVILQQ
jgi:hypothetical protein